MTPLPDTALERGFVCILGALTLLALPLPWLGAAVLAALVHELCHITAVILAGGQVLSCHFLMDGIHIQTSELPRIKALLCILAGPLGSFSMVGLCHLLPRTALCALVQGIYNLLPIGTLDGARALLCIMGHTDKGKQRMEWIEKGTRSILWLLALLCVFYWKMGIFPLVAAAMLSFQKNSLQTESSRSTIVLP